jgi:hypothetical protein
MLSNDNIHPLQAFVVSDLFPDPESAYLKGQEYKKEQEEKELEAMKDITNGGHNGQTGEGNAEDGDEETDDVRKDG